MKPMKFGIGQAVKRVEDARLIQGRGRYTGDITPEGVASAVFLRSPHAHATFRFTDLDAARAMPGVLAVLSAKDVRHLGDVPCQGAIENSNGKPMKLENTPVLAKDRAMHVGDAVAMVVAETEMQGREALEAIGIEWEPQPAVADMRRAMEKGAPQVWKSAKGNIAADGHIGDKAKTDAVFKTAHKVVSIEVVNNRLVANYMEPRAAIGEYDKQADSYTLHVGSQGVHGLKDTLAGAIMKVDSAKLRVVTTDVGGGFGTKSFMYREYPLVLEAAKRLGRPVRWLSDRTEHFVADAQGRDNITVAEMAMDESGRFLAMRVDILGGMGAYLSQFAPYIPYLGASMATGPYDIPVLHARVRCIYTHTTPVDAYRGAGRPEAAYVLERLVDSCARAMNMDRDAIRARNFVTPKQMPYTTQTKRVYDVGEFEGAMRRALDMGDARGFNLRAEDSRKAGKLRGFGFASYIECTAWGSGEEGSVELNADGTFTVLIGTQSNGQGHETAYAQVVSQYLDIPPERIRVVQGDTDRVKTGNGTGGSRSIPVGAAMVARASDKLSAQLKDLASDKLEAAVADLEIGGGRISVAGTDKSISFEEIAKLPKATPETLRAVESFTPPEATYPNGTHVCEVEIDPETGVTRILNYSICDDFGMTLNPLLLQGQVHGGVVQGIGQALLERTVFDEDGQLVTASFMDYCMPRADDMPSIVFETRNVPSVTNPMGLKGAGEAGSIGSCPAVMNAVVDALHRAYGIEHIDMPATPSAIHAAIRAAGGGSTTPAPESPAPAPKTARKAVRKAAKKSARKPAKTVKAAKGARRLSGKKVARSPARQPAVAKPAASKSTAKAATAKAATAKAAAAKGARSPGKATVGAKAAKAKAGAAKTAAKGGKASAKAGAKPVSAKAGKSVSAKSASAKSASAKSASAKSASAKSASAKSAAGKSAAGKSSSAKSVAGKSAGKASSAKAASAKSSSAKSPSSKAPAKKGAAAKVSGKSSSKAKGKGGRVAPARASTPAPRRETVSARGRTRPKGRR